MFWFNGLKTCSAKPGSDFVWSSDKQHNGLPVEDGRYTTRKLAKVLYLSTVLSSYERPVMDNCSYATRFALMVPKNTVIMSIAVGKGIRERGKTALPPIKKIIASCL